MVITWVIGVTWYTLCVRRINGDNRVLGLEVLVDKG